MKRLPRSNRLKSAGLSKRPRRSTNAQHRRDRRRRPASAAGRGRLSPAPDVVASRPPGPAAIVAPNVGDLPDEIADDFVAAIDHTVLEFKEGDIVEGTVVSVDGDGAMLDIGYKSEGIIPTEELVDPQQRRPGQVVNGRRADRGPGPQQGGRRGQADPLQEAGPVRAGLGPGPADHRTGRHGRGPVIEVVKGGLIVDIGLRGFLPASLVELRRVRDLDPYIGQEIEAKVIELDRNRNNVVLSRRAYLEEEQAEQRRRSSTNSR